MEIYVQTHPMREFPLTPQHPLCVELLQQTPLRVSLKQVSFSVQHMLLVILLHTLEAGQVQTSEGVTNALVILATMENVEAGVDT